MRTTQLLGRLLREVARRPGRLALAAAALLSGSLGRLGTALLVVLWAQGPLARRTLDGAGPLAALSLAVVAAVALLVGASRAVVAALDQALVADLRERAVASLLAATLGAARRFRTGDLVSRVLSDAGAVAGFSQVLLRDLLADGVLAAGAIVLMLALAPSLALALLGVALVAGLATTLAAGAIRRRAAASRAARGDLTALAEEQLRGLATVKGALAEGHEAGRFGQASGRLAARHLSVERLGALQQAFVFAVTGSGALAVLWLGSREAAAGRLPVGTLLAVFLLAAQVVEPVRRFGEAWGGVQHILAAASRVFAVLDLPPGERAGTGDRGGPVLAGALRVDGVRVAYVHGQNVLDGFSLEIAAGEKVALVAGSGGGKSTLAALLWRLLEPQAGRLLLDGYDLRDLPLASLRRAVCVVEQDAFLFAGPLLANLAYGTPGATREAVEEAVRLVGLGELVASLPRGLEEPVGERGATLSGGQRQRVALARAVLRDPRLLVLDEATQALDAEAEEALLGRLEPWLLSRTVLVMAHRLSTILRMPRALFLAEGRVVADGAPDALLSTCPAMRALFEDQTRPLGVTRRATVP